MDFKQIKIIIWDLDDTFWKGTLSEGAIEPIESNIQLIKDLTSRGIVNTICSKNDYDPVIAKLKDLGIADYFVFNSINWEPKGPRISVLLKDMGLRAANALFIDDNIVNLKEAQHYEPSLMVALPSIINDVASYFANMPAKDLSHSRLNNYKVLERKRDSRISYGDNESFLYASNTHVEILHDCLKHIDRIHELILRTNQLNFTKLRSTREELEALLHNKEVESGYVTVKDAFGEYGIVGFYAVRNHCCIHFLFSCRTIGQGVEQYVYATIGYPKLKVVGSVINSVTDAPAPAWINQDIAHYYKSNDKIKGKIVFKGPCDMMGLTSYLKAENIIRELTYISRTRHNNIEHQGCMTNFLQIPKLSKDDISYLVQKCVFNDEEMFHTALYDKDTRLIFLSSLQEFHFGIYRHKTKNLRIAFGEWNHPLTDPAEWDGYINGTVWTSSNVFTKEFLQKFSHDWEYEGRKSYDTYIEEIKQFFAYIAPEAYVCIFMGSEIPYEGITTDAWKDRHIVHREINARLRQLATTNPRLRLIDYTDFITDNTSYTDSIDHLQRVVHYKIAQRANEIIAEVLGRGVKQSSQLKIYFNQLRDYVTKIHVAYINYKRYRKK